MGAQESRQECGGSEAGGAHNSTILYTEEKMGILLAFFLASNILEAPGAAAVTFFLSTDCPISNFYSPEIQHICGDYASKGVTCSLVYPDPSLTQEAVNKHTAEYGFKGIPVILDPAQRIARVAGVTITPEAVITNHRGTVLYRGRIDNFYVEIGKSRQHATEHDVRRALDEILAGRAVTVAETKAVGCYLPPPGKS